MPKGSAAFEPIPGRCRSRSTSARQQDIAGDLNQDLTLL